MLRRSISLVALASLAVLGACGDDVDNVTVPTNTATVRFINATNSTIAVANNGSTDALNSGLVFGNGSTCLTVNSATPTLGFTNTGTSTAISGFTPSFATGGNYTVVAYTDANGNTQFTTLDNSFTPVSGQSGLRVFNAAPGSGDVMLLSNGTSLNNGLSTSFGNSSLFFSTPSGAQTFTFNTTADSTQMGSSGAVTLTPGQNSVVVLGPAASGSTTLRSFVATGC